jgi:hypothetical protein
MIDGAHAHDRKSFSVSKTKQTKRRAPRWASAFSSFSAFIPSNPLSGIFGFYPGEGPA